MQVPIPIFLDKCPRQLSEEREESKIMYMYNNICNMHDSKKKTTTNSSTDSTVGHWFGTRRKRLRKMV